MGGGGRAGDAFQLSPAGGDACRKGVGRAPVWPPQL